MGCLAMVAGCSSSPPPPSEPTPTPPPHVSAGSKPILLEDGRVQYHLVIRADAGVAFIPVSVSALGGTGSIGWTRWTETEFAFDEAANKFVPATAANGGERREEWVNVVFPGSNQELGIVVSYGDHAPPAQERFEVVYATMAIGDLAKQTYVKPEKSPPGRAGEKVPREPLGDRLRSVDVSRWLTSGFFMNDLTALDKVVVPMPGVARLEAKNKATDK